MTPQLREHGEGFIRELLIDKRLLTGKSFGGTASRLPVTFFIWVDNLWIDFRHSRQSAFLVAVDGVFRLPQNELARRCAVAEIQPVQNSRLAHPLINRSPGFSCVDTSNYEVHVRSSRPLLNFRLHSPPVQTPER